MRLPATGGGPRQLCPSRILCSLKDGPHAGDRNGRVNVTSSYIGTVLCLANSRKMSGRCVAGKAITPKGPGDWIRPVSSRPDKELSASDRHYAGGAEPALLDVINIQFLGHDPHPYQPEITS